MKKELPPHALERHLKEGFLTVKCHRIYKSQKSLNILLRPEDAIKVAANILRKVSLLTDEKLADEWTLRLWHTGGDDLKFGFAPPKEFRKKPKATSK